MRTAALIALAALAALALPAHAAHIAMIGDSTMASTQGLQTEQEGYGDMIGRYLLAGHTVTNLAAPGRSSKSYINEGLWAQALATQPTPDYFFVQFGHNDIAGKGPDRETDPGPVPDPLPGPGEDYFRYNLQTFINGADAIGAEIVFVKAMERLTFRIDGTLKLTNKPWSDATAAVAAENGAELVDLHGYSEDLYETLQLAGGTPYHMIDGALDPTHFNDAGARRYAGEVALQLQGLGLFAAPGDTDADGDIDDADLAAAFSAFTGPVGAFGYRFLEDGDTDGDGDVDDADLATILGGFSGPAVPEPAAAVLLLGALRRRR